MDIRLAVMSDLPIIKDMYKKIIESMNKNNICIWDDVYPCEYFKEDIINKQLYVLIDNNEIISAFVLTSSNNGADSIIWDNKNAEAIYIDRLGVNTDYLGKGIGTLTIQKAISISKQKNKKYLRLFVVDNNKPAICLYEKAGFTRAKGIYHEVIDDELTLHEYGYEIKL